MLVADKTELIRRNNYSLVKIYATYMNSFFQISRFKLVTQEVYRGGGFKGGEGVS